MQINYIFLLIERSRVCLRLPPTFGLFIMDSHHITCGCGCSNVMRMLSNLARVLGLCRFYFFMVFTKFGYTNYEKFIIKKVEKKLKKKSKKN